MFESAIYIYIYIYIYICILSFLFFVFFISQCVKSVVHNKIDSLKYKKILIQITRRLGLKNRR